MTSNLGDAVAKLNEEASNDHLSTLLQEKGITGQRYETTGDPVAVWIKSETGATRISVTDYMIEALYPDGSRDSVFTPVPLAQFCTDFDEGKYPELDTDPLPPHRIEVRHNGGTPTNGKPSAWFVDCSCGWGVDAVGYDLVGAHRFGIEHLRHMVAQ